MVVAHMRPIAAEIDVWMRRKSPRITSCGEGWPKRALALIRIEDVAGRRCLLRHLQQKFADMRADLFVPEPAEPSRDLLAIDAPLLTSLLQCQPRVLERPDS